MHNTPSITVLHGYVITVCDLCPGTKPHILDLVTCNSQLLSSRISQEPMPESHLGHRALLLGQLAACDWLLYTLEQEFLASYWDKHMVSWCIAPLRSGLRLDQQNLPHLYHYLHSFKGFKCRPPLQNLLQKKKKCFQILLLNQLLKAYGDYR